MADQLRGIRKNDTGNIKKLAQLLEQDQFELILPENVQPDETKIEGEGTRGRDIRLVYLMNDAAESFLVFRNSPDDGRVSQ